MRCEILNWQLATVFDDPDESACGKKAAGKVYGVPICRDCLKEWQSRDPSVTLDGFSDLLKSAYALSVQ